jgi:hypothetical protein
MGSRCHGLTDSPYPGNWSGGENRPIIGCFFTLKAKDNEVAIESITLEHEGISLEDTTSAQDDEEK